MMCRILSIQMCFGRPTFKGTHGSRGRNRPRLRLASLRRRRLKVLLIKGGVKGERTVGAPLLDAIQWHLGTLVPLKGKGPRKTVGLP